MLVVASLISVALFLAFFSTGAQKILFNPVTSRQADHLQLSKSAFRRLGVVEIVGGAVLLAGLSAKGSSALAIMNEVAAALLCVLMALTVIGRVRRADGLRLFAPALSLSLLALVELSFRLAA